MPVPYINYFPQLHGLQAQDFPHGQPPLCASAKPPAKRLIPSTAGKIYFFILFSFFCLYPIY